MEIIVTIILIVGLVVVFGLKSKTKRPTKSTQIKIPYKYQRKYKIVTETEHQFYKKLMLAIQPNEHIIPQAHLSSFLNHKIRGQQWSAAFSRINGKSIDFLVVDRETLAPIYGIEVDDSSHDTPIRITRDQLVNTIMNDADFPLIHFSREEWVTTEQIIEKIRSGLL